MKKLIPALALLLISAVLLSVASYAWFSMNTTVSATNMKVTATTSRNLVIAIVDGGTPGAYNQSVDADSEMAAMFPVSTEDLASWHTTTEQGQAKVNFNSGEITGAAEGDFAVAVNGAVPADGPNYYLKKTFNIKVSDATGAASSFAKLFVSDITVSANDKDISKSIRVGIKVDTTIFIYSPNGGDTAYKAVVNTDGTLGTVDVDAANTYTNVRDLGLVDMDGVDVDVFVWYEGQDTDNTSFNAMSTEELAVSISFTAED